MHPREFTRYRVVTTKANDENLLVKGQFCSSDPSVQSRDPSQRHELKMQVPPDAQAHLFGPHVTPVELQWASSDPSSQSCAPSQTQVRGRQLPTQNLNRDLCWPLDLHNQNSLAKSHEKCSTIICVDIFASIARVFHVKKGHSTSHQVLLQKRAYFEN